MAEKIKSYQSHKSLDEDNGEEYGVGYIEEAYVTNGPSRCSIQIMDKVLYQNPYAPWLWFTHYDFIYSDEMPNVSIENNVFIAEVMRFDDSKMDIWDGKYHW